MRRKIPYLKKDHAESNTLDGIENTKPEPQRYAKVRTGFARPWEIQRY
jgi:hypothetical protein